ncbi:hypothetical protein [Paraburkholderia caribensis]|uniref:hypothetical protein n=1 Tax=Paraburkholderia TaxID=1822464 RepID=UPI001CB065AB|nr:hypothetical protein [Paraburkholderia caribensis]BEU25584.1 hypothetical protein PBP221_57240 [Paraburkholderia sp. 22B1P]CAG9262590.1 conserved hypothetical protein [Paraburkholderia caribensis]
MAPEVNTFLATLDLVCPPIPNSSASHVAKHEAAVNVMRQSDFYMICGRAEAEFRDVTLRVDEGEIHFTIEVKGGPSDTGFIRLLEIDEISESKNDLTLRVTYGSSSIEIYSMDIKGVEKPVMAFSPDYVLMRRGRKEAVIGGLDNYLPIATYDLLYVGIATAGDSFDRLFAKGHHARVKILSDEPQRYPGARVSDEIYLFLFNVDPLFIKSFGRNSNIEDDDLNFSYDPKRLVSDAEKAFVSLLKPKYNSQLYKNYPRSQDGFYKKGLTGYCYSVSEGMSFRTQYGSIKGGRERNITLSNDADFIAITGDEVRLHIAGVDHQISA